MPTRPRFVFDTNAVVSAVLLKRSVARQAFDQAFAEGDLLVSAGHYHQSAWASGVAQMTQMQMKAAAFRLRWSDQPHAAAPFDHSLG